MYTITNASIQNIDIIIKYKLDTVLDKSTTEIEKNKIIKYVKNHTIENINNYKLIILENNIIGCYLIYSYEDGIMLDEIYIEEKYRNMGIGTSIITSIQKTNKNVYLWVRNKNKKAFLLYKRLNFKVIEKNDLRTKMLSENVY